MEVAVEVWLSLLINCLPESVPYTEGKFNTQNHLLRFPIYTLLEPKVFLNERWSSHCTNRGGGRRNILCFEPGMGLMLLTHGLLLLSHLIQCLKVYIDCCAPNTLFLKKQTNLTTFIGLWNAKFIVQYIGWNITLKTTVHRKKVFTL